MERQEIRKVTPRVPTDFNGLYLKASNFFDVSFDKQIHERLTKSFKQSGDEEIKGVL